MSDALKYVPNLDFVGQKFLATVDYLTDYEAVVTATLPDGFVVKATDSYRQNRKIKPEVVIVGWNANTETYISAMFYLEG